LILQQLREKFFPNSKILDAAGDTLTGRLPLYSMVANGFISCGDAAALVNPISGEGHGPALLSGYYASEIVELAIRNQKYDEKALWAYNKKIWNIYGYDGGLGIAVHKLLNAVPFSDFSYLFEKEIISQTDVDAIMGSTSAKIPVFKKVIKGLRKPKLLFKVARGLIIAEKIKNFNHQTIFCVIHVLVFSLFYLLETERHMYYLSYRIYMTSISIRVPDEIKKKMQKLSHINWSERLRELILKIIEQEENKNLAKALLMNEELVKEAPEGWDSTKLIRYWRDNRYGNESN